MGWFNKDDREAARAAEERLDAVSDKWYERGVKEQYRIAECREAYDDWVDADIKARSWWR